MVNLEDGVSILICCYNSIHRLEPTLNHIASQIVTLEIEWEVIVVDNNSTDNTTEIAKNIWYSFNCNIPFKVVFESEPGLMAARLRGIQESRYKYLVFSDDDNSLCSNYVETVYRIFEDHQDVGVINGDSIAAIPQNFELPFWWENYKAGFAVGKQGLIEGYLPKTKKTFWGAGISMRKEVLVKLLESGFKHHLVGRKGNSLTAGEDSELCMAIILSDLRLYYSPRLNLFHHIPIDRINKSYLIKQRRGFGAMSPILLIYSRTIGNKSNSWLLFLSFFVFIYIKNILDLGAIFNNNERFYRHIRIVSARESILSHLAISIKQFNEIVNRVEDIRN